MLNKLIVYLKKMNFILSSSQKKGVCIVLVLSIVGALFEMLGVSVILPLVQAMVSPEIISGNKFGQQILKIFGINSNEKIILFTVICSILIYWIKNIYLIFLAFIRTKFACKVQRELSVKMMDFYMERGYVFFLGKNVSELMRGIGASVASVFQVIQQILRVISEILTAAAIIIFILLTDINMALTFGSVAVLCFLLIIFIFKRKVQKGGAIYHEYLRKVNQAAYQAFEGIKEVVVMKRQKYFVESYRTAYEKQQKGVIIQNVASESPAYVIETMCVSALLIVVAVRFSIEGNLETMIPQLAAFAVAAFRILPSMGRISSSINMMTFYAPGIDEVYNNFIEADKIEKANQKESYDNNVVKFEQEIELKNISWRYPEQDSYVLEHLNLVIKKGQSIGFIGQSGAGKTTLADILLRLLNPNEGDIVVDGIEMCHKNLGWGNLIGFVSQAFYLNDDTIRKNIAFGIDEKDIENDLIWKALEQAQMSEFVKGLPNGLDTVVGERGIRFSGGQRQRLAIARALYFEPQILVLDEATSALDNETEAAVMGAIEALQGHKTLIIIAHRLTTIQKCDVIYRIADGKAEKVNI